MRPHRSASALFSVASIGLFASCATTPGAQPHDMSSGQHEAMAVNEQTAARSHVAQFSVDAAVQTERCRAGGRARADADFGCWTSVTNPTAQHLHDAKKHEKMAGDHRSASQALRDAEARACVGISNEDRAMSPFEHIDDIASVDPFTVGATSGKSTLPRTEGAVITFRAVPGMTAQWLQRAVDCHLARNAALGHVVPEMPLCPLVPKNVTAKVTPTDTGFAVAVRSDDPQTAQEILRRSRALVAR